MAVPVFVWFLIFFTWLLFYIIGRERTVAFTLKIILGAILAIVIYILGGAEAAAYLATGMTLAMFYHVPIKPPKKK